MADSGSLRTRRWQMHRAGDHSLCRKCVVKRAQVEAKAAGVLCTDPVEELQVLAGKLVADYEAARGNTLIARELRLTLVELAKLQPAAVDALGGLHEFAGAAS